MTTTYGQYFVFLNVGNDFLKSEIIPATENIKAAFGKDTKLGYAIEKVINLNKKVNANYQNEVREINIDHAATVPVAGDPKTKVLVTDAKGNYQFTAEAQKIVNRKVNELSDKEIEVEVYHATDIPTLTDFQKEVFTGFVIEKLN